MRLLAARFYDLTMPRELHVHLLPTLVEPERLVGGIAVVIDILRASTTIVHALAAGASAVIPCQEVDEARAIAAGLPGGTAVLGGERGGMKIPEFHLDNSPLNCTPERLAGKTLVFTTTNGTRAMRHARFAERIVIGAFVNLNAVLRLLLDETKPVHLVCAGTDGSITTEDALFAGAIVRGIRHATGTPAWEDDQTVLAATLFDAVHADATRFAACLRDSRGGRNLVELGFEADITRSAAWDLFDLVPELHLSTGRIEPATVPPPNALQRLRPPEWHV